MPGNPTEMTQSSRPTSIPSSSAFVLLTPEQIALRQASFDLAPLAGGVAGAIRGEAGVVADPLGGEAMDELGRLAALRKGQRAQPVLDERRLQLRGLGQRRCAQTQLGVLERGVPEHDRPFRTGGTVVGDHRDAIAEQRGAELAGIRDRRGRQEQLGLGAVEAGEAPQPAQDVRDVRAEDAAVDVGLVDDHIAQVGEDVAPTVVVRQEADVEHVRVREDHVGRSPDAAPVLDRRVAVVDRRAKPWQRQGGQCAELILRECLRRVEVERTCFWIPRDRVEHREVEGKRLAGRGPGGDANVLAPGGRLPGGALVRIQVVEADRLPHER